jgi:hypothetical protein
LEGNILVEIGRKRSRPTQIVVDLKALKDPWAAWCSRRGLTPSEAVRRVLGAVLNGNPDNAVTPHPADYEEVAGDERRRIEIRVLEADYLAAAAAADREGMGVPKWLTALLKVHLAGQEPLGRSEVEALARSNQLLLALGRNINQIAYNMNQRVDKDELTLAQIEFLSNFLKEHVQSVAAVMQANSRRWRR